MDHGLLDRVGVSQGERAVGREVQRFQHGPGAVEGQHHLPPRRAEEVVLKDARAVEAARLDLRQSKAVCT